MFLAVAPALAQDTPEFIRFAEKSAELYRGSLMTRGEMANFTLQLRANVRAANARIDGLLQSIRERPYNSDITSALLAELDYQSTVTPTASIVNPQYLHTLKQQLNEHQTKLKEIIDVFNG